jgi:hypothetical protein
MRKRSRLAKFTTTPILLRDLDFLISMSVSLFFPRTEQLLAQGPQRLRGKDRLDGKSKHLADPERQIETGVVFASFQISDGLIVHPDHFGEILSG